MNALASSTLVLPATRQRRLPRRVFIAFVITMSLGTFQFFPGVRPFADLWTGLCFLCLFTLYPLLKSRVDWTFSNFELYLLGMIPVLILLPAIGAWLEFGQPVWYGALAQRSILLAATWLLFINAWRSGWLRREDVEAALVFMVWTVFVIFSLMQLLLQPASFGTPGFVAGSTFAPPGTILLFGLLYYALRGVRERRFRYYVYSGLLLSAALGGSGRTLSLGITATVLFFLFRWQHGRAFVRTMAGLVILVAATLGVWQTVSPTKLQATLQRYEQALQAITNSSGVQDPSAVSRVYQSALAFPYIRRHPVTGVGTISAQWHGTNSDALGAYFFPGDLGVLGVLFSYGVVGLFLSALQYYFAIMASHRARGAAHNSLMDACKGFVLCDALLSPVTGEFVFGFEYTIFYVVLLILLANDAAHEQEAAEFEQPLLHSVA